MEQQRNTRPLAYPFRLLTIDIINEYRYYYLVIKTFANKETAEIWRTGKTKGRPPASVTKRKLADLKVPPANRLEKLRGDRQGQFSIRINEQYRICFVWRASDAYDVEIADYH
jgi:proteic killer suppression protein